MVFIMDEKYVLISERIRELREIFDLSVEDMARETGVDVSIYNEYESSGKNIPISVLSIYRKSSELICRKYSQVKPHAYQQCRYAAVEKVKP